MLLPNEEYVEISYDQNEESKEEPFLGYMDDESQLKSRFGNTEQSKDGTRPHLISKEVIEEI